MAHIREHRATDTAALQATLFQWTLAVLQPALARGPASMLLSGGRTPLPFYRQLAQAPLPWQRLQLALVDERWVDVNDDASNERAIRVAFAGNTTALAHLVTMKTADATAQAAVADCNVRYASLAWPPVLGILGMGNDGHTASLFPGAEGLDQALASTAFCAAIKARPSRVTGPCTERMTLTLCALLQCERLALLVSGDDKWQVYQQAKAGEDAALPVSLLLARAAQVDVFWSP